MAGGIGIFLEGWADQWHLFCSFFAVAGAPVNRE
jgi:hypothetical protein